jgi:hypothetical protein
MTGPPPPELMNRNLELLRSKFLFNPVDESKTAEAKNTDRHNDAMNYFRKIKYVYGTQDGETESRPSVVAKPHKIMCKSYKGVPEPLRKMRDFFVVSRGIDPENVNAIMITVYPPPMAESSYETTIDPATMMISDRIVYIANSDEFVYYCKHDVSGFKDIIGPLASVLPANSPDIPEHFVRNYAYHFNSASAIALRLRFNDEKRFQAPIRDGAGWKNRWMEKRVRGRYIIVFDFAIRASKFRESMKDVAGDLSKTLTAAGINDELKEDTMARVTSDGEKFSTKLETNPKFRQAMEELNSEDIRKMSSAEFEELVKNDEDEPGTLVDVPKDYSPKDYDVVTPIPKSESFVDVGSELTNLRIAELEKRMSTSVGSDE